MTTNVPLPSFTPAGLAVPDAPALLAGVFADYVAAFAASGHALNTELTTPQGQLAQSQAFMLSQLNAGLLQIINAVDPATSSGAYQDALGRIYRLTRQPATFGTVSATVTGVPGSVLPAGAQVRGTADGSLWSLVNPVTIGPSGSAPAIFRADVAGSAPAVGPNGLAIYRQVPGWEGVSNATAATPGTDTESRQAFEQRREESVQIGGHGTAAAVRAAVGNVPGVVDAYVYNNGSGSPVTYGPTNYVIPAHSVAVVVAGGSDDDVAGAIHSKLDAGCGMSDFAGVGSIVTVPIEDRENYNVPYPTYQVRFVRPAVTPVYFRVEVASLTGLPATYVDTVRRAVSDAFNAGFATTDGSISVRRARIGGQVVAAEYFAPILTSPNIVPVNVFVGLSADPTTGSALTLGIDQRPVCTPDQITVVAVSV